jgi:hypothetical protein
MALNFIPLFQRIPQMHAQESITGAGRPLFFFIEYPRHPATAHTEHRPHPPRIIPQEHHKEDRPMKGTHAVLTSHSRFGYPLGEVVVHPLSRTAQYLPVFKQVFEAPNPTHTQKHYCYKFDVVTHTIPLR